MRSTPLAAWCFQLLLWALVKRVSRLMLIRMDRGRFRCSIHQFPPCRRTSTRTTLIASSALTVIVSLFCPVKAPSGIE
jgi:hypothetical protein